MKVVSFILSLVAICSSSFIKSHYSLNQGNEILKQTNIEPYSHNSHPYIPGFSYSYGYVDANRIAIANKKTGYFYYDMDVYFTDFTSVSRLFLIRVKVDFTPGCEAYDNGNKEFDSRFSLYKGYTHINLYQKLDLYAQSSSIAVKQGWPQSSNFTSTVTSSYGSSINLNATLSAGVSLTEGLSAKAQAGVGLTLFPYLANLFLMLIHYQGIDIPSGYYYYSLEPFCPYYDNILTPIPLFTGSPYSILFVFVYVLVILLLIIIFRNKNRYRLKD